MFPKCKYRKHTLILVTVFWHLFIFKNTLNFQIWNWLRPFSASERASIYHQTAANIWGPLGFCPGPNDPAGPSANRSKKQIKFTTHLDLSYMSISNGFWFFLHQFLNFALHACRTLAFFWLMRIFSSLKKCPNWGHFYYWKWQGEGGVLKFPECTQTKVK